MNILILSWRGIGHPNAGGAEISTYEHAKGWVKAGHSVTLFTSFYKGAARKEQINGINIIRQGKQFLDVQWQAFKWYLFGNHTKFDLVIDEFHGIPFFTPLYIKAKKLGFIHEVAKEVWGLSYWAWPFNLIPKILGPFIEPLIFKLYKNVPFMTVSESTKDDLIEWGIVRDNISVVHNGVKKFTSQRPLKKENQKTIIFLGALAKDKGIEQAIEALSVIQKNYKSNFQYWIVGKGEDSYLRLLETKVEKLGVSNIKFWGYVSEERKFELLAKSHILINPSIREGWGLVVIEAALVGTPTVAFNVPGLKDSIKDNETGILCKMSTPKGLASEVINLLSDRARYNRISHNAKNWSKNFSWEKSAQESLKLINSVLINS